MGGLSVTPRYSFDTLETGMSHVVGDAPTLDLTVTPYGPDTVAVASARTPAGVTVPLSPTPGDDTSTWSVRVPLTEPGEWLVLWSVTGTGAATARTTLAVAPAAGSVPLGRVYATTGDLALTTGEAPPPEAARLLLVASRRIERATKTAVYATDVDGYPTDTTIRQAFRAATVAQAAWWGELGDDTGSGSEMALAGSQIGDVKLGGMIGSTDQQPVAPTALEFLEAAGLTTDGPIVPGGCWW